MKEKPTKVVFRKWTGKDFKGDIIALFPEIPASNDGYLCQSYEHIGQHGAADYNHCLTKTVPADQAEYADLKKELESIGYCLKVVNRATYRDFQNRINDAKI